MTDPRDFDYLATDRQGRRVRGRIGATDMRSAYAALVRQDLSPIRVHAAGRGAMGGARTLSDRAAQELIADLAALLRAGADLRTSLQMLAARAGSPAGRKLCGDVLADVSAGKNLSTSLVSHLAGRHSFVGALVAAGESGAGVAAALERSSEILQTRGKLTEQLVAAASYPAFVFATSVAAFGAILFLVIPAIRPLVENSGTALSPSLAAAIWLSSALQGHFPAILAVMAIVLVATIASWRIGAGRRLFERMLLDGPTRGVVGGLVYGGFAVTLGSLLAGGAAMSEALRLSSAGLRFSLAKARLDDAGLRIRQGEKLSDALTAVRSCPSTIIRLASVGEASGALGPMLVRGGKLEEERAVRQIESIGKIAGPALIVLLGGVVGLLMASLLSGISQLGDAVSQ